MNSHEPLMENASEYWKIIDNLRSSNEELEKEINRLKTMQSITPGNALAEIISSPAQQTYADTLLHYDFILIINHLNNVVFADKNGLQLWNVVSPELMPKVRFVENDQNPSQDRTKSTYLVLPENNKVEVLIEEIDLFSSSSSTQDLLLLVKPVKPASKATLVGENYRDIFTAEISKPIRFSEHFGLVKTTISEKKNNDEKSKEISIDKNLSVKLPLQILLAEDNLINQKLIIQLLNKMGYSPDTAMNGAEAIMMLEKKRYDILFMDIQMPVMDGLEATRTIVSNWPKNKRPHIIAMTANVMHGDREKCLDAGMEDYLSKPIKFDEVEEALMKWGSVLT